MSGEPNQPQGGGGRARGLRAIDVAREQRSKMRWPSARFWAYVALILAVSFVLHWKWSQGKLESERQSLLAKQRGVAAELGPRWFPLRDSIEGWVTELAKAGDVTDVVDKAALASWDFREKPGIYLRLRVDEAGSSEGVRAGAKGSLRDAFTSCFTRAPNESPTAGRECKRTGDCERGQICNENDRCSKPAQPYNLRVAYRALRVLTDDFVREVQDANDIGLRALGAAFDDAARDDFPTAIDLLTRAQYFLVVLDEGVDQLPEGSPRSGSGASEALLARPHFARVAVYRLSDKKLVLRTRREAAGVVLGGDGALDPQVAAARARQINSCALAMAVRGVMGDSPEPAPIPAVEPAPSTAPSAGPSAAPSAGPSAAPSAGPSAAPSAGPSAAPSAAPSAKP
jgi:hypothetical protein